MPSRRRDPLAREEPAELQVAATNGSIVTDSRGKKYIDFVMGWCVGNFGWNPPAIAKAMERFRGPDYVYPGYAYAPWTELARLLTSLAPRIPVARRQLPRQLARRPERRRVGQTGTHQEPAAALRQDPDATGRQGST